MSSLGRVAVCILDALDVDLEVIRKYETMNCQDVLPYHAIFMLLIRVLIDLLPSLVFTRIFGGLNQSSSNPLEQTLFSAVEGKTETSGM